MTTRLPLNFFWVHRSLLFYKTKPQDFDPRPRETWLHGRRRPGAGCIEVSRFYGVFSRGIPTLVSDFVSNDLLTLWKADYSLFNGSWECVNLCTYIHRVDLKIFFFHPGSYIWRSWYLCTTAVRFYCHRLSSTTCHIFLHCEDNNLNKKNVII